MKPKDTSERDAGFDHPCKQTCSGWQQGYERGYQAALDGLEMKTLVEALEYYGFKIVADSLNYGRTEVTTELGKRARIALEAFDRARKDAE